MTLTPHLKPVLVTTSLKPLHLNINVSIKYKRFHKYDFLLFLIIKHGINQFLPVEYYYWVHEHNLFAHSVDNIRPCSKISHMSSPIVHLYEHCHFNLRNFFSLFTWAKKKAHVQKNALKSCSKILLILSLFAIGNGNSGKTFCWSSCAWGLPR